MWTIVLSVISDIYKKETMEGLAEDRIRAKESHALKGRGKLGEGSQPKTREFMPASDPDIQGLRQGHLGLSGQPGQHGKFPTNLNYRRSSKQQQA